MARTMIQRTDGWVRPDLLRWARQQVGLELDQAASELHVEADKLRAWEQGTESPSIQELERLARLYVRSVRDFFLDAPPREPTLDLRLGPRRTISPETRELLLLFRLIYEDALDLLARTGQRPINIEQVGEPAEVLENSEAAAVVLRRNLANGSSARGRHEAFQSWRTAIEHAGVLTFSLPLKPQECRGASLWPQGGVPAIVMSGRDSVNGRTFTLLHEFAHLAMLETAGDREIVCSFRDEAERAANAVAANVLVPSEDLHADLEHRGRNQYNDDWSDYVLGDIADGFKVSKDVIAIRLEELNLAPKGFYWRKRDTWDAQGPPGFPRGGVPGRTKWERKRNEVGDYYGSAIAHAWRNERITFGEAVRLLDLPPQHTKRFLEEMAR